MKSLNSVASFAGLDTNTVAPVRECFEKIDFEDMDSKRKTFLEKIVVELEQAQLLDFSSKYRYIHVGLLLIEAKKELSLSGDDWEKFYALLGLKERAEQRYRQIASSKFFKKLPIEDAHKLHHLTQANMITMSKETDKEKFNEMLNNSHSNFSKPKATEEEIKLAFKKAYKEASFTTISLSQYKEYCAMSMLELIKLFDITLSQFNEISQTNLSSLDDEKTEELYETSKQAEEV